MLSCSARTCCNRLRDSLFIRGSERQEKEPGQKKEGKTHNDMWVLNMKAAVSGGNPTWDRVSQTHLIAFTNAMSIG